MRQLNRVLVITAMGAVLLGFSVNANAVPSFARQTGMQCAVCHTSYPELTQFGRTFKLNGYTLTGIKQIEAEPSTGAAGLKINEIPPLSAMLQISSTSMKKQDTANTQNNSVGFPQAASLFFAGEIADHLGAFLQMTYEQESGSFGWDNTDVRYANQSDGTIWGVTLNNNPTVQDLWNSTPAWGFPFSGSSAANTPVVSTLIDGPLAGDVGGLGAYAMFANHVYTEVSAYRSAHQGSAAPNGLSLNTIKGVAPYWRLAWQNNFGSDYLMLGTYGMITKLYPIGFTGETDKYTDAALDAQYEHYIGSDMLAVRATYINERNNLDATVLAGEASKASHTLNTYKLNGTYHFAGKYSATLAYFSTAGNKDNLLYTSGTFGKSLPDSDGEIVQLTYLPWQNVQVTAQYTAYGKFNGTASNYDGTGRNASDNNTIYLLLWLMW